MVKDLIARALQPIKDQLAMVIGRGVLLALSTPGGGARAQVAGVAGETLDDREYAQDYGLSSRPHPGAEAVMAFLAGWRSNGMVLRLWDRRYTLVLEYGEVAIHDDLGQKVHLTRTGIVASSPMNITVKAGETLRLEGKHVQIHAGLSWSWDVNGFGQKLEYLSGVTWKITTWQQGHVMAPDPVLPINPPEGPGTAGAEP